MDLTGKTLGSYEILEKLGEGGMGAVFKAIQRPLNRTVALKVLPPELARDGDFAARFLREGQAVAALDHPNIVPIYEGGTADGYSFLAMRLISGHDLSDIIKERGRLSLDGALTYLEQAAAALDAAHARGIVHRDIKPSNMMVENEKLYLTDFGIAKSEGGEFKTRTGMIVGTPEYMSPEQLQGGATDGRLDVYALGVVAYQMLTGQVPFSASTPAMVIYRKMSEPLPDIRAQRPEVSAAVAAVIAQAMATSPTHRYGSAGQFVRALRQASVHGSYGAPATAGTVAPPPGYGQASMPATGPTVQQPGLGLGQPGYGQPTPPGGYTQPGYGQPTSPGGYNQPGYGQASPPGGYTQPGYGQPTPPGGYTQPGYRQPSAYAPVIVQPVKKNVGARIAILVGVVIVSCVLFTACMTWLAEIDQASGGDGRDSWRSAGARLDQDPIATQRSGGPASAALCWGCAAAPS